MKNTFRLIPLFMLLLGVAGCSVESKPGKRAPLTVDLVKPEHLQALFGAPGTASTTELDHKQYLNTLDYSTLSSAEFKSTVQPVRILKARLSHKPQSIEQAKQEFFFQKDEITMIKGLEEIPDVKLGDESAAYTSDQGRNFRLVVRQGNKVVQLHLRGSDLPPDSVGRMGELAGHMFAEAEKVVPTPSR